MTIKKRIFYTNTWMVFLSLIMLLGIGGIMISFFKKEVLNWYGENSELSENHYEVYQLLPQMKSYGAQWEQWSEALEHYDFRLLVMTSSGEKVYSNVKHNEWEGTESLFSTEKSSEAVDTYLIEGVTILVTRCQIGEESYDIYLTGSAKENLFFGMDRGMFEMFLMIFLVVGLLAIGAILLCSQLLTKLLIQKILKPVNELDKAAKRVVEGELSVPIAYQPEDEFKNVCDSFDLMQQHLKEGIEKNAAYEKARTEMVSGISHDLRTPLTSVKGYIKGMMDGVASTEEKQKEYLEIAYRKSCDMDVLLSKLFYFSKLETGNMPFFRQRTEVAAYIRNYASEKELELKEKKITLKVFLEVTEKAYCNLDREQIHRVLDNLIENSVKYSQRSEGLILSVRLSRIHKKIEIDFSDNGIGVPEEKLSHIFEQFYRGDESRSSQCNGNGLGLYVCQYIIKEHGGSIRAYNMDGLHICIRIPEMEGEE